MIRKLKLAVIAMLAIGFNSIAQQDTEAQGGTLEYVGHAASMRIVPSMASRSSSLIPAPEWNGKEPKDGKYVRGVKAEVVPGKDPQTENDRLAANPGRLDKAIHLNRNLENDFVVNNNVGSPSDPALAVGPDHVFIVYNTGYIIYDKDGNDLTGPLSVNNIFSAGGCCDLTATYDNNADRWVITYLFVGAGLELAVSSGPDPITSTWTLFSFPQINDYNKMSRWTDGYYITDNGANDVWVIDRDAVLAGDPAANIQGFNIAGVQGQGFTSAQVANITDDVMPTTGGAPLVYMRDDGFAGVTTDAINIWTLDIDFDTPANSTVSAPEVFADPVITPFINVFDGGGFSNLTQPGGGIPIDALQSTIMNQMQFRKFATHNSLIFNFVVDTDASAGELAGIRWYEFRQTVDGGPWSLEQEGTYTAPDGRHAWNGSMAMDNQGNIGMGYSSMAGPTTPNPTDFRVGAYYTGQLGTSTPGVMNVAEEFIGSAGNIAGLRFGDYAKADVDPSNDKEFWFITEYQNTNHVAVFQIQSDFDNDIGVVAIDTPVDGDLAAPQDVTVTIFNFGLNDASGFDVTYSIDGTTVATEAFPGTIAGGASEQYTFTAQGDFSVVGQTYEITAATVYGADEFNENDATTRNVTHLNPDDVGAISITATPSDAAQVTIEIENFGTATQTSIPVFYTLDGNTVQETYTGSIALGETDTYTFTATEDLSALGDYVFTAGTELAGDADETNDDVTATITNAICEPESNCAGFDDGVTQIQLADQDIATNCGGSPAGYSDDTDIIFNFVLDENPFEGVLQVGFNASTFAIWIDFNDNNSFEADELVVTDLVANANSDFAFTVDFSTVAADVTPGMHRMRLRGEDDDQAGDLLDPCDDLAFGRTNDYTANISGTLGTTDELFATTDLQVHSLGNDQFEVVFNNASSFSEKLPISVYNTLGQTLAYYTVDNNGGGYTKTIDMSYVSNGVYFVKVGNADLNKVKRIIVGAN